MSHSREDIGFVNRIYKALHRAKIAPNIAEFEEVEAGKLTAPDIVHMIHRSRLVLLFLTENVMSSIYTQNWVNFELGCAYGAKTRPAAVLKDIYVFEPFQQLQFPIPYLDFYVLFEPSFEPNWEVIEGILFEEKQYWSRLFPLLFGPRPSDRIGQPIQCTGCGSMYTLLSEPPQVMMCPTCRRYIS